MFCVPTCVGCKRAGVCPRGDAPALPRPEPVTRPERARGWAPNQLPLTDMPCGCVTIPWPLLKVLGANIETFLCERHGEVKITKAWRERKNKDAKLQEEIDATEPIPF